MTIPTTKPARHSLGKAFNLPNQLTSLRLILSVVLFGLISAEHYIPAFVLFLVAVGTDWLDGYYARKFNQITTLGRILDPFADKVIVCGTFIFLVTTPGMLADWRLSAGVDGRGDCRPRIAGDGLAEFPGRARQRLFGEPLRQAEDGAAMRCRRVCTGLSPLPFEPDRVQLRPRRSGFIGSRSFRFGRR